MVTILNPSFVIYRPRSQTLLITPLTFNTIHRSRDPSSQSDCPIRRSIAHKVLIQIKYLNYLLINGLTAFKSKQNEFEQVSSCHLIAFVVNVMKTYNYWIIVDPKCMQIRALENSFHVTDCAAEDVNATFYISIGL